MEKLDALVLAGIEKSDNLDIHERHAFEVERPRRVRPIDVLLQFIEMLRLQSTAKANDRLMHNGGLFNP